jgi:hypothetical protein
MKRFAINPIAGLSAYSLSKMVAEIRHIKGVDKAVLRGMVDHYPNVWPGVETLADESGWGTSCVRESIRRLEIDNWVNAIGDKRGGTGNSEQYVINDRKILVAHAMQTLEDGIQMECLPIAADSNPMPDVAFDSEPTVSRCLNPTRGEQTQRVANSNPPPAVGEPTIEPIKNLQTNLPTKRAAGALAKIFGQAKGIPLPGGDGTKNQKLVAEAMTLAPNRVVELWKHWLATRDLTGMKYPLGIFVSELPGLLGADSSSEREYTKGELAAVKAMIDRQAEIERNEIMNRMPEPERVLSAEDVFGTGS